MVRVAVELPESDAALRADGDDVMTVGLPTEAVDGKGTSRRKQALCHCCLQRSYT